MRTMSLARARRLALGAQGFADAAPSGRVDRRHLRRAMGRMKLLQLDSVPVVIRSHYLPLYSRLGPYPTAAADAIAYEYDEWFEAWAHEASLLPIANEPLLRWMKEEAAQGWVWKSLMEYAELNASYIDDVLAEVGERGPLAPGELSDPRRRKGEWWDGRSEGTRALDWLYRIGSVGVRRRANFAREFDLIDKIVPPDIRSVPTPRPEDAQRELVAQAAAALGVGTAADVADYFRMKIGVVRSRLDELVEDGRLDEVSVEGWQHTGYVDPNATVPRRIDARALLSPFDPVVWNRDRAERLFDFRYRIEIYTPKAKREFGYYVLPFLLGDRLVARLDLKTDLAGDALTVLSAFTEQHADPVEVAQPLVDELAALAALVGVSTVAIAPDARGDLPRHLTV